MYKILISGYYGFNNIGDESILRTVIDNLREKLPDVDITVLSQDPAGTAEKYGVKSVRRMSLPDIFRAVRRCDLLLSGGGSLLRGLEDLIEAKTGINTMIAEEPMTAVAIGTGKFIEFTNGERDEK